MFTQCTSARTGEPLKFYQYHSAAQQAADHAKFYYGRVMVPYQCDHCDYWHLCPEDRHTPSETCHYCTSSEGKPKQLYATYEAAKKRADCLLQEKRIKLDVYECRHQQGWHLTKSRGW
ncbi:MAG: hypothetical protein COB58_01975 [Thalassobium sp.]|nr:MAG: hypothetical protein COB58_14125 [Thalassobium sp.]PHQ87967.1 MAG: hypothetical protein COB58_01975 [Thalassobium sp.]